MPYPIEDKLVVGVASYALFDLKVEDAIFREKGLKAYNAHQNRNRQNPYKPETINALQKDKKAGA
jgi:5'-nucleotidase